MGDYELLFSVEIAHQYFDEPARLGVRFRPDETSRAWLAQTDCLVRGAGNRLRVYYRAAPDASRTPMAQTAGGVELRFGVVAADPLFANYTDDLTPIDAEPLRFGGGYGVLDGGVWKITPPLGPPRLSLGDGPRPDFVVCIPLAGDLSDAGRSYRVELNSRATTWKYILLGDWKTVTPRVVDTAKANAVAFEAASKEVLADGRSAWAIRSRGRIPLAERPGQRFQLCDADPDNVLINPLPAAGPDSFGLEVAGDAPSLISEIYVPR